MYTMEAEGQGLHQQDAQLWLAALLSRCPHMHILINTPLLSQTVEAEGQGLHQQDVEQVPAAATARQHQGMMQAWLLP